MSRNIITKTQLIIPPSAAAASDRVFAQLNGSNEYFMRYVNVFSEAIIAGDCTIMGWFKPLSVSGAQGLVCRYTSAGNKRSYLVYLNDDELRFANSDDGATPYARTSTNANLLVGNWYHLAVVYDASEGDGYFYKDGVLLTDDGGALATSLYGDNAYFYVGRISSGYYYNGGIAKIVFLDRTLSQAEIQTDYGDLDYDWTSDGNIIAQWDFTDDPAVTAIDNLQGDANRDILPTVTGQGTQTYANCGRTVGTGP